jgi:hypothetical protein
MRNDMIQQIEAELPNDIAALKQFSIELLMANQLFQDRCKVYIRTLEYRYFIQIFKD